MRCNEAMHIGSKEPYFYGAVSQMLTFVSSRLECRLLPMSSIMNFHRPVQPPIDHEQWFIKQVPTADMVRKAFNQWERRNLQTLAEKLSYDQRTQIALIMTWEGLSFTRKSSVTNDIITETLRILYRYRPDKTAEFTSPPMIPSSQSRPAPSSSSTTPPPQATADHTLPDTALSFGR